MPLFEPLKDRTARLGVHHRVQVPLMCLTVVVIVLVVLARDPSAGSPYLWWGLGVILAATTVMRFVPLERGGAEWFAVLGGVDVIGCLLVNMALAEPVPSVFLIAAPPLLWLSYGFSARILGAALVGALMIAAAPFLSGSRAPSDPISGVNAVFLVLGAASVLVAVHSVGRLQRSEARRLRSSYVVRERLVGLLRQQQVVGRAFADTLDVGLLFLTPDGEVAFTNRAFEEMNAFSGFDDQNLHGAHVYEADRVTRRGKEDDTFERVKRGEFVDGELIWIGEPGNQRAILATTRPVDDHDGTRIGYALVSSDATRLAQEVHVREEFLAGVSHELRTPLTSIVGFLDIIDETVDARELGIQHELGIIQRNVDQLLARIEDLLHVSDRAITLRRRRSDVSQLASDAIAAILRRASDSSITLDSAIEPGIFADVDPRRVGQVLDNLLTNAIKYTPSGGRVMTRLERQDDEVVLSVEDSGVGISVEDQRQVFERFFRSDTARESATPGAGLGLAIVASIMTAHGGSASVRSTLGAGSTFTVRFPVEPVPAL